MIKDAICFILHENHLVTISWGGKNFGLDPDESITLPRLYPNVPPKDLWELYKSLLDTKREGVLGRSSFYNLIQDLTVSTKDSCRNCRIPANNSYWQTYSYSRNDQTISLFINYKRIS